MACSIVLFTKAITEVNVQFVRANAVWLSYVGFIFFFHIVSLVSMHDSSPVDVILSCPFFFFCLPWHIETGRESLKAQLWW